MVDEFLKNGYWTQETFHDFWDRNAREYEDREALVDSKYRLTWAEAKRLADAMAISWIEMGIPKHSRIIIQSPNSVYGFLSRIACEKAGCISLTVYPYLRERELEYMVERTEATAVVIPHVYRQFNYLQMYRELQRRFPHLKYFFLFDDEVPAGAPDGTYSITQMAYARVGRPIDEKVLAARRFSATNDVALLTTTSGTTGIPKLVEWPTAPRLCTSKGRVDIWNLNKDDITVAIAPHAGGAAGTLTYFAAPLAGAKTVMLEEFSPDGALALIEKEKATAIGVVPTHLVRMSGHDTDGRCLFLFDEGQGPIGREFLQHDGLCPGQRRGKIGECTGGTTGMRRDGHGNIVLVQVPDIHPALGCAEPGSGGPFHKLGNAGGSGCRSEQRHIPYGIQPSFRKDGLVHGLCSSLIDDVGKRKGPFGRGNWDFIIKQEDVLQVRKLLLESLV